MAQQRCCPVAAGAAAVLAGSGAQRADIAVRPETSGSRPEKRPNGNYVITWKTDGKDYTMTYRFYAGTYALDSLIDSHP